jgi:tetratricopeptide (TPR) repeat protein
VSSTELLRQGVEAARAGQKLEARKIFMQVVEIDPPNDLAWLWLSGLMDDLEERIIACENVLTINPANEKVRVYLDSLLMQKEMRARDEALEKQPEQKEVEIPSQSSANQPVSLALAEQLEDEGKIEEAIKTYELLAARTKDRTTFDHIYKQISRLEGLQTEKIQYVAPDTSLLRMSFTWTLVYVSFVFIQVGLRPFAHFSLLWLGLPFVAAGNFLLSLSEVRIKHAVWQKVFLEEGTGSSFARVVLAVTGWVLIIVPFGFMLLSSLFRLQNFQIPPEPF